MIYVYLEKCIKMKIKLINNEKMNFVFELIFILGIEEYIIVLGNN